MPPGSDSRELLDRIWEQRELPVVFRPEQGQIRVKLPYRDDNYEWLRDGARNRPKWHPDEKYWTVPAAWYERILKQSLARYGAIYTIRPGRKIAKCAPACWNAVGPDCECSCEGANHGSGVAPNYRWNVISESLAIGVGPKTMRCTLLVGPNPTPQERRAAARGVRLIRSYR